MLTKAELAEIRARADAATEGPWEMSIDKDDGLDDVYVHPVHDPKAVAFTRFDGPYVFKVNPNDSVDADFIAHSRTDIPILLAHIEELEAKAKQVRDEALEEAAKVCEARGERLSDSDDHWGAEYANRIRALKEQNNG